MKEKILGFVLVLLFSLSFGFGADFVDEDGGFTLSYPDNWTIVEGAEDYPFGFVFKDKKAGVYVSFADYSEEMSALEYLNTMLDELGGKRIYESKQVSQSGLEVVGADDGAIGAITYKYKKVVQTRAFGVYIKGDRLFIIMQWLPADQLAKYHKDLGEVAKSFRITYGKEEEAEEDSEEEESEEEEETESEEVDEPEEEEEDTEDEEAEEEVEPEEEESDEEVETEDVEEAEEEPEEESEDEEAEEE